jgi:GNAT superfamily N-acetyltransferase
METIDWIIRPAGIADAHEVIRLAALMYDAMGLVASDERWRERAHDAFVNRLGRDMAVVVADDPTVTGRLAATGAGTITRRLPGPANPDACVGYIQWISTDPRWRRRGLARRITRSLLDWYDLMGVPWVELHATPEGEGVYRSLGFDEGPNPALRFRGTAPPRRCGP